MVLQEHSLQFLCFGGNSAVELKLPVTVLGNVRRAFVCNSVCYDQRPKRVINHHVESGHGPPSRNSHCLGDALNILNLGMSNLWL